MHTSATASLDYRFVVTLTDSRIAKLDRSQGEVSALLNLSRSLGGFSVAYFQVPWVTRNGAIQTFGVEAAIVAGLFLLVVPALQLAGNRLRVWLFSLSCDILSHIFDGRNTSPSNIHQ